MKKFLLASILVASTAIAGMTAINVLDTFVFTTQAGKIEPITSGQYDWDFDSSSSSKPSSSSKESSSASSETSFPSSSSEPSSSFSNPGSSSSSEDMTSSESSSSEQSSSEALEKTTASVQKLKKNMDGTDVTYYIVDIHLKRLSDLRTYLATDADGYYGTNITQKFPEMIKSAQKRAPDCEILAAISGDFPFWKGRTGYVVRDGQVCRESVRSTIGEDLAIYKDGTVMSYLEEDVPFDEMYSAHGGCYQNWSFGPALIQNGKISVTKKQEIDGETMSQNQRIAIGYAGEGHFYFMATKVSGYRGSPWAKGFSLYQLAETLLDLGCTEAYNMDGGNSATLWFGGELLVDYDRALGDMVYVVAR